MADEKKARGADDDHPGYLFVKTARDDDRVALHEVDDRHPADALGNHEVMVGGKSQRPQHVAKTPKVLNALRQGQLEEVDEAAHDEWVQGYRARQADAFNALRQTGFMPIENTYTTREDAVHNRLATPYNRDTPDSVTTPADDDGEEPNLTHEMPGSAGHPATARTGVGPQSPQQAPNPQKK